MARNLRSSGAGGLHMTVTARGEVLSLEGEKPSQFHGIVGESPAVRKMIGKIVALAASRSTVLIVGESGTGKELVARAIHQASAPNSPFVALNCAALPKDLIESELFGYVKGAFSGANQEHLGLFRSAQGGTLFLDEITEMSPETQAKLLRAIQERCVRPVGGMREIPVDVCIIASTNREPAKAVLEGQLRKDLYYRLAVGVVRAAPLRERTEDIPVLLRHFVDLFNAKFAKACQGDRSRDGGVRPVDALFMAWQRSRTRQCDRGRVEFQRLRDPAAGRSCTARSGLIRIGGSIYAEPRGRH